MIKTRIFSEHNYKGIHMNGKTIRIALDPKKPITELLYPEFYDIAVTKKCFGNCSYCYQDSTPTNIEPKNIIKKVRNFFKSFTQNQLPFQIAYGGGEVFTHKDFLKLLKITKEEFDIVPNYTTNGMWIDFSEEKQKEIIDITKTYCGGVAVSTHPHLEQYWRKAVELYLENDIFTNLHVIISDKKSIDDFMEIYNEYTGKVKYFVLLPLSSQGRCKEAHIDWDYVVKALPKDCHDIAFGANFYPYLLTSRNRFNVSLYSPESMSGYLDLTDMRVYKSSFSSEIKTIGKGSKS